MIEAVEAAEPVTSGSLSVYVDEPGQRVPLKVWSETPIEQGALDQALNLTRLPFALSHVALMPDAHQGYGMPIGGVLFTDRVVVPYAVGVDIGCGVTMVETDLVEADLASNPGWVLKFLTDVNALVPVGNGPIGNHPGYSAPFEPGDLGTKGSGALWDSVFAATKQLGTLGGGNHFVELQTIDDPLDGRCFVMIHSGSRSVGKKTCDDHHATAAGLMKRWRVELPDKNLAWLPMETDEARAYWSDMEIALRWAEENRRRMAAAVVQVLAASGVGASQTTDVHHNYAAWESHFGKNGIVHRKGAVRARVDERVLIPGSMGTASYVATGLGFADTFQTCQHGAGRAMSRGAATRAMTGRDLEADLAGTILVTPDRKGVVDEAPIAYKDVESVMRASASMVRPITRLRPLGVLKG